MIRAYVDHGHWSSQVRKLGRIMKQTMEETLRGQAKLFTRDAIRFTPPFGDAPITEPFARQLEIGKEAVYRDRKYVFKEASSIRALCQGRFGENITKLVSTGKTAEANTLLMKELDVRNSGLQLSVLGPTWKKARDRRGRVRGVYPFILHDGILPSYNPGLNDLRAMPEDPELRRLLVQKLERVGSAKSGWVKAASSLKLPLPRWIKKAKGASSGTYHETGSQDRFGVEVRNNVPFIQASGRELRIVDRALKNRQRNIQKQIEAAFKAAKKRENA